MDKTATQVLAALAALATGTGLEEVLAAALAALGLEHSAQPLAGLVITAVCVTGILVVLAVSAVTASAAAYKKTAGPRRGTDR